VISKPILPQVIHPRLPSLKEPTTESSNLLINEWDNPSANDGRDKMVDIDLTLADAGTLERTYTGSQTESRSLGDYLKASRTIRKSIN
jgi:hypothetical protein